MESKFQSPTEFTDRFDMKDREYMEIKEQKRFNLLRSSLIVSTGKLVPKSAEIRVSISYGVH